MNYVWKIYLALHGHGVKLVTLLLKIDKGIDIMLNVSDSIFKLRNFSYIAAVLMVLTRTGSKYVASLEVHMYC